MVKELWRPQAYLKYSSLLNDTNNEIKQIQHSHVNEDFFNGDNNSTNW